MKILITIIIILIIFMITMIAIDSNRFVTRNYEIVSDKLKDNHRVVFLSDLHNKVYGDNNDKLLQAIDEANPDVILIGGDIMTAYPGRDFSVAVDFVRELTKKYRVVYALGNHEYRARIYPDVYGDLYDRYEKEIKDLGIEFLDNTNEEIFEDVAVYGFSMEAEYYRRFILKPMEDGYVESQVGQNDESKFSILLAHNPEYFKNYVFWNPDLILSGHLHGGVVRVPGWRGVISPMWHLFPKYAGGLYSENNTQMIVSRGLGMHTIPLRLFNPAESVVIDLKKK